MSPTGNPRQENHDAAETSARPESIESTPPTNPWLSLAAAVVGPFLGLFRRRTPPRAVVETMKLERFRYSPVARPAGQLAPASQSERSSLALPAADATVPRRRRAAVAATREGGAHHG